MQVLFVFRFCQACCLEWSTRALCRCHVTSAIGKKTVATCEWFSLCNIPDMKLRFFLRGLRLAKYWTFWKEHFSVIFGPYPQRNAPNSPSPNPIPTYESMSHTGTNIEKYRHGQPILDSQNGLPFLYLHSPRPFRKIVISRPFRLKISFCKKFSNFKNAWFSFLPCIILIWDIS